MFSYAKNWANRHPCSYGGLQLSGVFVNARASRVISKISKSDTPSAKHYINSLLTFSLHESESKPT